MPDNQDSGPHLGGTVASRLAKVVADATVYSRQRMGDHQSRVAQTVLRDFTNHVSDELRGVMGPLWRQVADDPATPAVMRDLLSTMATTRGQAWAWVQGTATSTALGGGLLLVVQNTLYPTLSTIIRMHPNLPLAPGDAAAAVARRIWTEADGRYDAGGQGIAPGRFDTLVELNRPLLSPAETLEALRRGHLTTEGAMGMLRRNGFREQDAVILVRMSGRIVTTPDVAAMWNRGIITTEQAWRMGDEDGTSRVDMDRYLELGGEPPAVRELLLAWRRGIITEDQVDRAIRQGPIRFEWIPVIKSLQWEPLPPGEAADAVNQGHMDLATAQQHAAHSGIRPEDFAVITENAGLPPGVELATEAWNRGLITDAEFRQAFLESRLKNRYVPLYEALRWRVIPQETVLRLYRRGVYTRELAAERLGWAGYSPVDREALLAAEDGGTDPDTVALTKSEVLSLYSDRAIDKQAAIDMLTATGVGPGEVDWLLMIADLRRERTYVNAVLTRVRAGYVAYRLDANEASGLMDSLQVPPEQRDELLSIWDLERLATTRGLTPAQIKAAAKKGLIDQTGAVTRLAQQGYSAEDAELFLRL